MRFFAAADADEILSQTVPSAARPCTAFLIRNTIRLRVFALNGVAGRCDLIMRHHTNAL